jgi:hypothetical protein
MSTPDVWQHVLVGKALWQLGRVPQEHLWTWPLYGTHDVLPSWGFRWLLWPFWQLGEAWGTPDLEMGDNARRVRVGVATARRLGARGLTPWFVVAIAALTYRTRGQVRPETLVAGAHRAPALGARTPAVREGAESTRADRDRVGCGRTCTSRTTSVLRSPASICSRDHRERRTTRRRVVPGSRESTHMPMLAVLGASVAISFANPFGWRRALAADRVHAGVAERADLPADPRAGATLAHVRSYLSSGLPFFVAAWSAARDHACGAQAIRSRRGADLSRIHRTRVVQPAVHGCVRDRRRTVRRSRSLRVGRRVAAGPPRGSNRACAPRSSQPRSYS